MTFGILGPLEVHIDGQLTPPAPQLRWLLAALLLHNGEHVRRDDLLLRVWGPDSTSQGALTTAVSRLRTWLQPVGVALERVGDGYRLRAPRRSVDADRFRTLIGEADVAGDDRDRLTLLVRALDEWRGQAVSGAPVGLLDDPVVSRLNLARLSCAQRLGELAVTAGRPELALGRVAALCFQYEYDEPLHATYLRLLAAAGRRAEGLRHYETLRRRLREELGTLPSTALQRAHRDLLAEEPVAAGSGTPESVGVPEIATGQRFAFAPFQLPADLPDFVGRRDAVVKIVDVLTGDSDGGAYPSVASITGMPGTGKSALAVHSAHLLRGTYPDGQIYLDLAGDDIGLVDVHDALGQVLLGLGFATASLPATAEERSTLLRSWCAGRRVLLVLDNARTAQDVLPLLPANPRCGVLVTSRTPLGGLTAWPEVQVTPFDQLEAIDLLARIVGPQRAAAEPDAAAKIADLCAGLPLALRIAGTRLAIHSHQRLGWLAARLAVEHTRLDELAVTGVALRSSLDISYLGLSPAGQRTLRLLSLLEVPDFGPWLAAAVLGCTLREAEDGLAELIEARLLSAVSARAVDLPRYRLHQLIRLYAKELATEVESAPVRAEALGRAYTTALAIAEEMEQGLRRQRRYARSDRVRPPIDGLTGGPTTVGAADWFAAERATLVAVTNACAELKWYDLTWDLSLSLRRYLEAYHHHHDWQVVATAGLEAARSAGDRAAEPALLCSLGELYAIRDEYALADEYFALALGIATELGDNRARAAALRGLCTGAKTRGDLTAAARLAREAIDLVDEQLDPCDAAEAWLLLGATLGQLGERDAAAAADERALDGFVAVGDRLNQAIVLVNIGTNRSYLERWDESEQAFKRSIVISQEIGFRSGEGFGYTAMGSMLRRRGENQRAEQSYLTALAIVRDYADEYMETIILYNLGELHRRDDLDLSRRYLTEATSLTTAQQMPAMLATVLIGLGETEQAAGRYEAARSAWTRAIELVEPVDSERAAAIRDRLTALATA